MGRNKFLEKLGLTAFSKNIKLKMDNLERSNKKYVDDKEKTLTYAEYQALSEEEKNNGTTYYVSDMPVSDTYTTYSTEEIVIGKWIDGKPIYRKTFYSSTGFTTGEPLGKISDLKLVINVRTVCFNSSGNYWGSPYQDEDQSNAYVKKSTGDVYVHNNSSFVDKEQFVVVEYTKTTD